MRALKLSAIVLVLASGLEGVAAAAPSNGALSGQDGALSEQVVGGVVTTQQGGPPPQRPQGPQGRTPAMPGGPQRPTRDPRLPASEGTASLSGRVVDAATGQALARVRVRFMGRDGGRSTMTDAEGAFSFTKLPRGSVSIIAEKAGFLTASFPERQRTMRNAMLPLADGQRMENVSIPMTRSSAIVGRVVDQSGEPVENAMVTAIAAPGTSRRTQMFRPGFRGGQGSNDIGEFRIGRLDPGTYYLLASPQRRPDDDGAAMGRTYYPGVASLDQAQTVTVEKGQTVTGIELMMLDTTLVKVMGTVVTSSGEPVVRGNIMARMPPPPGLNMPMGMPFFGMPDGNTSIRENGSFELRLQPGEYTIDAMPMIAAGPGQFTSAQERGQVKISVGSEPLMNVVILTGSGGKAMGRLVFNGRKAPPADLRGATISFQNAPGTDECRPFGMGGGGPSRPTLNPDGTFVAENLWGACVARVAGVAGWQLEAVTHRGNDVTNRPIQFQAGQQVTDIQLVLTDRVGDLSLEVADERGLPLAEYVAVVFPIEKERWGDQRFVRTHIASTAMSQMIQTGPQGEMIRSFSTAGVSVSGSSVTATGVAPGSTPEGAQAGVARPPIIKGLIAGEYYAVVVDDLAYDDLRDVEFLSQLANVATRVSIVEGDARPLQLRRVPVPDSQE